jgi:hypothetical protein
MDASELGVDSRNLHRRLKKFHKVKAYRCCHFGDPHNLTKANKSSCPGTPSHQKVVNRINNLNWCKKEAQDEKDEHNCTV